MVAATLWPVGQPLSGLQVYENMRAVDYLLTRKEVDGERLGITGTSGGGNQTMYAGAWDERFKAVVPVCSVGNYQAYLGVACCMCEVVPGALRFTEEWGVLSLTAPRALMVINATQDGIQFSVAEAKKSLALTRPIYALHGKPKSVKHLPVESKHDYNEPMREAMYGADDTKNKIKADYAKNCILARRLIEKGVRFVQLFNGAYATAGQLNWDGHQKLREQYDVHGPIMDQPSAALIRDLKQRGMLKDTLILWCTEFGRMPMFQKGAKGRDHNPGGFTAVLTGAGIKAGVSHGSTDELGFEATENIHPFHDLHATMLHLLGLDHEKLTFNHNGIQRRLTDVHGHVIQEILA